MTSMGGALVQSELLFSENSFKKYWSSRGVPYGNGPGNEATARLVVVMMINTQ